MTAPSLFAAARRRPDSGRLVSLQPLVPTERQRSIELLLVLAPYFRFGASTITI
jgi:hypothetical protein